MIKIDFVWNLFQKSRSENSSKNVLEFLDIFL